MEIIVTVSMVDGVLYISPYINYLIEFWQLKKFSSYASI